MKNLYIALFGLLGVFSRYYVTVGASKIFSTPFPYGTFFVNIAGAFAVGVIYVLGVQRALISPDLRVGIIVGFLGGFTTFSSYCLEALRLAEDSEYAYAAFYLFISPTLGFLAAFSGMALTRFILAIK